MGPYRFTSNIVFKGLEVLCFKADESEIAEVKRDLMLFRTASSVELLQRVDTSVNNLSLIRRDTIS